MDTPRGVWLDDLTWQEAAARLATDAVVLLPVVWRQPAQMASHLPMKTATTIARALAQKLVESLPVVMAPLLDCEGEEVLRERLGVLGSRGARRLGILDLGLAPARPTDLSAEVPLIRGCNGGDAEDYATSCMLALDPRSVRMSLLPPGSHAQALAGERLMAADVEALADALSVRWEDIR